MAQDIFSKMESVAGIALLAGVAYLGYKGYKFFFPTSSGGAPAASDKSILKPGDTGAPSGGSAFGNYTGKSIFDGMDEYINKIHCAIFPGDTALCGAKTISPPIDTTTSNRDNPTPAAAITPQPNQVSAYFSGQSGSYGGLSDVLIEASPSGQFVQPMSSIFNITPAATVHMSQATASAKLNPSSMTLQQQKAAGLPYFANGKWYNK